MNAYRLLAIAGATFFTAVGAVFGSLYTAAPPAVATTHVTAAALPAPPAAADPGALAEQPLDTLVAPPPAHHAAPSPEAPPKKVARPEDDLRRVRTPADEDLPKWVPARGRLTVVDSADLAENLGVVPPGSTAASAERIRVADELAKQQAARPPAGDPIVRGISWNLSARRGSRARR